MGGDGFSLINWIGLLDKMGKLPPIPESQHLMILTTGDGLSFLSPVIEKPVPKKKTIRSKSSIKTMLRYMIPARTFAFGYFLGGKDI